MDRKLDVCLVNASLQEVDQHFVRQVLPLYRYIAVREPCTYRYLKSAGLNNVIQAADSVFLSDTGRSATGAVNSPDECLYTPGVLSISDPARLDLVVNKVRNDLDVLTNAGLKVTLFQADKREQHLFDQLSGDSDQIRIGDYAPEDIFKVLERYRLVVSGRYHLLIFSAMLNIPFIGLPTNTWKTRGLLELLGLPYSRLVQDTSGLAALLRKEIVPAAMDRVEHCRILAARNFQPDDSHVA